MFVVKRLLSEYFAIAPDRLFLNLVLKSDIIPLKIARMTWTERLVPTFTHDWDEKPSILDVCYLGTHIRLFSG